MPAAGIGDAAADARDVLVRRQDQVAARERDLRREARSLATHRVLRHLDRQGLAGLQDLLDPRHPAVEVLGRIVDLARVQHRVSSPADVDEGRLHAREHVLHAAQIDVADHRVRALASHVVLHQHALFEDRDLVAVTVLGDDHDLVRDSRRDRSLLAAANPAGSGPRRADATRGSTRGDLILERPRPCSFLGRRRRPRRSRTRSAAASAARRACARGGRIRLRVVALRLRSVGLERLAGLGVVTELACGTCRAPGARARPAPAAAAAATAALGPGRGSVPG